jgi:chromosome segregation ATPase
MSKGITEDQLKQIQESGLQIAATELTIVGGERQILDQGRITESFMILEHGAKIESLNKEIEKKDDEIVALQKALQEVREKYDELTSALKSKDVEIETLTSRIDELEEEKRELQRKLGSVEFDLGLLKKEVEKLGKAKSSQEQTSLKLKQDLDRVWRNMETVKGDLEKKRKENDDLKKELKEVKDSQHKGLLPLMLGAKGLPIKPPPPHVLPKTSLEASLHLGEMCR